MFEFNEQIEFILGRPNFWCGAIAHKLVKLGHKIPTKAEAEQAAVIYWMLDLYEKHGDGWREEGEKILAQKPEEIKQDSRS